ncbi:MAG: ABC transporter substrate-binding protein [Cyanobacteria bacterium P01_E01_bin.42]
MYGKFLGIAIASFLLVIFPVACFFAPAETAEIPIGLLLPLTGELADTAGKDAVRAAELAAREANLSGGLRVGDRQQKVKLFIEDDGDTPDIAIAAARKLIYQDNVSALAGLSLSRIAIPVARVAEEARIPAISNWSTNPETTAGKDYIFRVIYTDDFVGKVLANWVRTELNYTRAAVLYDIASEYNRGLAEFFQQEFEKLGGKIVAFESFTTDETDFIPQLERIRESGAKLLFLPNYPVEISQQLKQMQELGIQPGRDIEILGCETWSALDERDRLILEGSFFTDLWSSELENPKTQAFVAAYREAYQETPSTVAALTYDAIGLIFQAIESGGRTDPESIRQGLTKIQQYGGVSGRIIYPDNGDPDRSILIMQFQGGQAIIYKSIEPEIIP